jgi:HK97 family phage major capsid protein
MMSMTNLHRSAAITKGDDSIVDPDGRVTFPLSSEDPFKRHGGIEVLDHTPRAVDLTFLKSGNAPLLDTHDRYTGLAAQLGVVEDAWLEENRLYVTVRFGSSARAIEVRNDVASGIIRNVSVGYQVIDTTPVDIKTGVYKVTKWRPYEASFVPLPADTTVGIGRSAQPMESAMTTHTAAPAAISGGAAPVAPAVPDNTEVRVAAFQSAVDDINTLAASHARGDLANDFIRGAVARGETPNVGLFKGILASKLPSGTPLVNTDIGMTAQERQSFSLMRLATHLDQPNNAALREAAAFEIEATSVAGQARNGDMIVPTDVLNSWNTYTIDGVSSRSMSRAAESVAGNPNVITTAHMSDRFIDNLRDASALGQLGVTTLGGMTSNFEIPGGATNSTAYWVGSEDANVAETGMSFRKVSFSLKTVGAYIDLTRDFLMQATIDGESYVRRQLLMGMALEASRAGLYGTGLTGIPTGLKNIAGIGSVSFGGAAPTRDKIIDMVAAIDATNQLGDPVFTSNTTQRAAMQKVAVEPGSGQFLLNGNTLHTGEALRKSNQIAGTDVFAGVWSDFVWALWGGLDLKRSTEAKLTSGGVRLVAMQSMDFNVTRVGSFVLGS